MPQRGVKMGFLIGFILTVGIGSMNFGYSIAAMNSLGKDFQQIFN